LFGHDARGFDGSAEVGRHDEIHRPHAVGRSVGLLPTEI
jgi:hypothetical protein